MSSTITSNRRAAIYVRISDDRQIENTSLESQEQRSRQFAGERGYTVQALYSDVHSGYELWERPQVRALLDAIRRREVDAVIAYALDRLSRNQVHTAILVDECERAGVELLFVTEEFERSAVGDFIRSAKAFAAELEREKIKERSTRGLTSRVRSGNLPGGGAPLYGYRWRDAERSGYEVDSITGPVVRRIFAAFLNGQGLRGIAAALMDEGIPSPRGAKRWSPATISKMLRNPCFSGDARAMRWKTARVNGRTVIEPRPVEEQIPLPEGTIPRLVDPAAFAAVQERLRYNQSVAVRNNQHPERFLLRAGFVVCGYCGFNAAAMNSNKGVGKAYWPIYEIKGDRFGHACGYRAAIGAATLDAAAPMIPRRLTMPPFSAPSTPCRGSRPT